MAAWHRSRRADLGLRVLGLLFCTVAYCAISRLVALKLSSQATDWVCCALAGGAFVCASAGSALLTLGSHLFDQIDVGPRWRGGWLDVPRRAQAFGDRS